ncbi:MAG TPA: hypothetical protein VLB44_27035, partial [Kofleriaceae bacterium]|nr:hypothetical protein [Kofleriaceae bacterium]
MRAASRIVLIAVGLLVVGVGRAHAYPQFELSKDQSCAGCHISPTGGGLLSENGMTIAESISKFGTAPEFLYGAVKTPDWIAVGGDFRGAYGYLQAPQRYLIGFPMQGDLYGNFSKSNFSLQITAGFRPTEYNNETWTHVWSREHYLMWQSEPGAHEGVFVRVGRFMPVFGLRFAEHPVYTRRYGGTPLYSDTYGAGGSFVTDKIEAHVTAFVKDPLIDPVRHSHGAAVYAEYRVGASTLVGAGAMAELYGWQRVFRGTLTAKQYLAGPDV